MVNVKCPVPNGREADNAGKLVGEGAGMGQGRDVYAEEGGDTGLRKGLLGSRQVDPYQGNGVPSGNWGNTIRDYWNGVKDSYDDIKDYLGPGMEIWNAVQNGVFDRPRAIRGAGQWGSLMTSSHPKRDAIVNLCAKIKGHHPHSWRTTHISIDGNKNSVNIDDNNNERLRTVSDQDDNDPISTIPKQKQESWTAPSQFDVDSGPDQPYSLHSKAVFKKR